MIVCFTGATGFIGGKLIKNYLKIGADVRYITRKKSNFIDGAMAFVSDLNVKTELLEEFFIQADVFFHCAGEVENEALMQSTHVEGTINLLTALEKSRSKNEGVFHWIQLSSCGAYGQNDLSPSSLREVKEESQENPKGTYECTKTESDRLIVAFARKHSWFKYTIIRPTIVFGDGMSSKLIIRIASMVKKRLFFYIGHKNALVNFVHVDDVVDAMNVCVNQPNAYNQVFIVSNDCKLVEVVNTIAQFFNVAKPRLVINAFILRFFVYAIDKCIKLPINLTQINVLMRQTSYSSEKIKNAIGWMPSNPIGMQIKQYLNSVFSSKND